jgi:hypothetical protein
MPAAMIAAVLRDKVTALATSAVFLDVSSF